MILYLENPKDATRELLVVVILGCKFSGYKFQFNVICWANQWI